MIAHRGASAYAPESTQAAIRLAAAMRADMVELDVQLTQDDRLVVFHDDRLERTSDGRGRLAAHRYRELARLDCGAWFSPSFSRERLVLASQALALAPRSMLINFELKRTPRPAALVARFAQLLRRRRAVRRVLVSSFDWSLLARLSAALRAVAIAPLCARDAAHAIGEAVRLRAVAIHPHTRLVTPRLIACAHAAGLRVHAWTVDAPQEARRLVRLGVDGLFTNTPDRLRAACRAPRP